MPKFVNKVYNFLTIYYDAILKHAFKIVPGKKYYEKLIKSKN